jgi:hypothetical protein
MTEYVAKLKARRQKLVNKKNQYEIAIMELTIKIAVAEGSAGQEEVVVEEPVVEAPEEAEVPAPAATTTTKSKSKKRAKPDEEEEERKPCGGSLVTPNEKCTDISTNDVRFQNKLRPVCARHRKELLEARKDGRVPKETPKGGAKAKKAKAEEATPAAPAPAAPRPVIAPFDAGVNDDDDDEGDEHVEQDEN